MVEPLVVGPPEVGPSAIAPGAIAPSVRHPGSPALRSAPAPSGAPAGGSPDPVAGPPEVEPEAAGGREAPAVPWCAVPSAGDDDGAGIAPWPDPPDREPSEEDPDEVEPEEPDGGRGLADPLDDEPALPDAPLAPPALPAAPPLPDDPLVGPGGALGLAEPPEDPGPVPPDVAAVTVSVPAARIVVRPCFSVALKRTAPEPTGGLAVTRYRTPACAPLPFTGDSVYVPPWRWTWIVTRSVLE